MAKKKRPEPKYIKGQTFGEMITEAHQKQAKAEQYVKETGLCCACKKNKVAEGRLRCQECIDKTEELLEKLRGPGFMELRI